MKKIVHKLAHRGNARGASDEHHFINLLGSDAGVGQRLLARPCRARQYRFDEQLEDLARNLPLVAIAIGQLDVEARHRLSRKQNLGFNGSFAHSLNRARMQPQIDAVLGVNLVERNGHQKVVDVVAAQMRIAVSGQHLEDAFAQFEDRDVESAAAQIVDGDGSLVAAIEAIGKSGSSWLIDEAEHFKSRHAPGILGGLALRIVEVGGHGDDGLGNRRRKEPFGIALELAEDVSGNLRRSKTEFA